MKSSPWRPEVPATAQEVASTGTPTAQASSTLIGTPEPQRIGAIEIVAWAMTERMSRGDSISRAPAALDRPAERRRRPVAGHHQAHVRRGSGGAAARRRAATRWRRPR